MEKKIVKLNGGLGNQMFQYAFGQALFKKFKIEVVFDFSFFEEIKGSQIATPREFELGSFNLTCNPATKEDLEKVIKEDNRPKIKKLLGTKKNIIFGKYDYLFESKLLNSKRYYYDGYFQNEKYFKNIRAQLLKDFSLKETLDEQNQTVLNKIKKTNSVSLHVRRGDYVSLNSASQFHGTCTLDYYRKAIEYIAKRVENPHFFLFSDDINWVIENLKIEYPFTIVDFNQGKGYLDMNLMKHCKHNIVANSSFSWWGAWLNENSDKIIIAPEKWILKKQKCDIIPKEWVRIS